MPYVLESKKEFARLEKQSTASNYDYRDELHGLNVPLDGKILDAGCGSGVVSRYLAEEFPRAQVTGCDFSPVRVEQARDAAKAFRNLHFETVNLTKLPFEAKRFDVIVCRFVLQHLQIEAQNQVVVNELFRVLKPGGTIRLIDTDGLITDLYPLSRELSDTLERIQKSGPVDLKVGRKLPSMLLASGFETPEWQIIPFNSRGDNHNIEITLMKERFDLARPGLAQILGSETDADHFIEKYLATMKAPGAVYFHNKFVVTAIKSKTPKLRVIE